MKFHFIFQEHIVNGKWMVIKWFEHQNCMVYSFIELLEYKQEKVIEVENGMAYKNITIIIMIKVQ